jgi:hypothetical protein|tara:strand:- start:274 stop:600 length:327 start_codon:yes stop_codon:yes gene_type:complete
MALEWRHKRYLRVRLADSSLQTFSSVDDAKTKIGFNSYLTTNSPTITYELADSNTTLVATIEYDSQDNQDTAKTAIDGNWPYWTGDDSTQTVEQFESEWLNQDGSVSQ